MNIQLLPRQGVSSRRLRLAFVGDGDMCAQWHQRQQLRQQEPAGFLSSKAVWVGTVSGCFEGLKESKYLLRRFRVLQVKSRSRVLLAGLGWLSCCNFERVPHFRLGGQAIVLQLSPSAQTPTKRGTATPNWSPRESARFEAPGNWKRKRSCAGAASWPAGSS